MYKPSKTGKPLRHIQKHEISTYTFGCYARTRNHVRSLLIE